MVPASKPSKETVIRTVILMIALINNALALFGKSPLPIDNETVITVISFLFTTGSALVSWWYNNSFTSPAILADEYLRSFRKQEQKDKEEDKCEE